MRTVNIDDLRTQISAYLQYVRNGEEVVVRDRNIPVARILPIPAADLLPDEQELVASGVLKLPEKNADIDVEAFWAMPAANVPHESAVQAVLEVRKGDR